MKDYLEIAGNVHLAYYVEAADKLGIKYEIFQRSLIAKFYSSNQHWFIINTVLPINNAPSCTIAKRKNLTNKVLSQAGLPATKQQPIRSEQEALQFFNEYKDVVFKPVRNLGGNGVSILPSNEQEVLEAYKDAHEMDLASESYHVLGEQFVHGHNYRILVLDDQILGVVKRLPADVVGDGASTISQLIEKENEQRSKQMLKPIKVDEQVETRLRVQSLTLDSVPEKGRQVLLRFNSNLTSGGTSEECSKTMHPYYATMAVNSIRALGLEFGGVDLIASDITDPNAPHAINEINYNPGLRLHYKVDRGEIVDVALPIMQYIHNQFLK